MDGSPTLDQLIRQHEEKRAQLQAVISRTEMELRRVETELEVLSRLHADWTHRRETSGQGRFKEVVSIVGEAAVTITDAMTQVSEIRDLDRSAAVERVLDMTDRPLSPTEIEQRLRAFGRDDEYDAISAALAYLKRSDRAHTPRRGEWVAGPDPDAIRVRAATARRSPSGALWQAKRTSPGGRANVVYGEDPDSKVRRELRGGDDKHEHR